MGLNRPGFVQKVYGVGTAPIFGSIDCGTTEQQISATTMPVSSLSIKALDDNAGSVYIARTEADLAVAADRYTLGADEAVSFACADLDEVWIVGTDVGDSIKYVAVA
jgi:hypothetical protein